jgi:aspartyl-tRNA(Asn)/glutamyl-tRNA(Gln) amidotransferase subunit B
LRWDDIKGKNFLMRTKENADDYRYFPEPDIPSVFISEQDINKISETIPELPNLKMIRYVTKYELDPKEAEYIAFNQSLSQFFDECITTEKYPAKSYSSWILGELAKYLNALQKDFSQTKLTSASLNDLLDAVNSNVISNSAAKAVFQVLLEKGGEVDRIIADLGLAQISDTRTLEVIAKQVIDINEKSVQDYRSGKSNALGFLIGQCMKHSNNKANPVKVKEILLALLG